MGHNLTEFLSITAEKTWQSGLWVHEQVLEAPHITEDQETESTVRTRGQATTFKAPPLVAHFCQGILSPEASTASPNSAVTAVGTFSLLWKKKKKKIPGKSNSKGPPGGSGPRL